MQHRRRHVCFHRHGEEGSAGGRGHKQRGACGQQGKEHACRQERKGREGRIKMRRLLEHGDLRILLLALLEKKPAHGYELIKLIEESSAGLYTPSPGVIYPTLTLLEEMGHVESMTSDGNRRSYQLTPAGQTHLVEQRSDVEQIFSRLGQHAESGCITPPAELKSAMHELKRTLRHHMAEKTWQPQQLQAVVETLNEAIQKIHTLLSKGA